MILSAILLQAAAGVALSKAGAAVAAAIAYLIYYYRESIKSALTLAKEKGKKLLNSCCEDFSDFADL